MQTPPRRPTSLVGPYKNGGASGAPGQPEQVNVHDFPDRDLGKAIPYGVYDVAANTGWVSVGADHDTAAFAVETIRRWWRHRGRHRYPHADRLLITADGGGSNGYRSGLWKIELAAWPPRPACRSPSATCRPAPRNGVAVGTALIATRGRT